MLWMNFLKQKQKYINHLNLNIMKEVKIKKVLNQRSDDTDFDKKSISKKEMSKIEAKTADSTMPCCSCGDQWS